MRGIKGAMIVSFLKQVLKLFWDNCKWAVLSHLLEKCFLHFFVKLLLRGQVFFIFNCLLQIEFWSQLISEYWNRTTLIPFLQAILNSVTLFIRILWIDSHSWLKAPLTFYVTQFAPLLLAHVVSVIPQWYY